MRNTGPIHFLLWHPSALVCGLTLLLMARPCAAQSARQWAAARSLMVETEVASAGVKHQAILAAMRTVPRHEFVPADSKAYAYFDMALPIGEHQTISPPFVVARMTEQLDPQPTDRVLEIGTGSGYQAAVLSSLVKEVYTIEIVPKLAQRATGTFTRLKYKNIQTKLGDGFQGWEEHAPFDKVIVTCSPEKIPRPLVDQLREGGRIVAPLGERYQQTLYALVKQDGKLVVESREPTFFVPMTGQAEQVRKEHSDGPLTELVNGDFERMLTPAAPAGWYYLRQAEIIDDGPTPGAKRCIAFNNRVPGRSSQALQAIGADGRKVRQLAVELWVKAKDIQHRPEDKHGATVMISFFDENRAPIGQETLGSWTGTFEWQRRSALVEMPSQARVAIVAVGLLGATGELECDQLTIRAAGPRTAKR